jgi:hypothetical protein
MLRDLVAFEEPFWLLEQSVNVSHPVVIEVSGATTIGQWKDAMDATQVRCPLLSAPLWDFLVVEEEMEKELQKSFGDGSGPG